MAVLSGMEGDVNLLELRRGLKQGNGTCIASCLEKAETVSEKLHVSLFR